MSKQHFDTTQKGVEVSKYTIENAKGMQAVVTDFGATVIDLLVPDRDGNMVDVALGYDNVASYENETTYFGTTVGPYANRISDAKIEIDGVVYQLDVNDNENNLHSGFNTWAKQVWTVKEHTGNKIVFTYSAKDLEQGFPGNMTCDVTYEVTENNEFAISYYVVSDKKTTINMTNHTYFNLNGWASGDVYSQELMIKASGYTPVKSSKAIPTGEVAPVEGTPFDFRVAKPIGRDIEMENEQLTYGNGYDHNFAIDKETDGMEKVAEAYAPESGIVMSVLTDCIGIQLYTGNFIGGQIGKHGHKHNNREGFCLETQYFPNSINEPNFVRPVFEANVPYETKTVYAFSTK
ncbi:MAG: aldose epimerase family protein [Agathobacter sp.]